MRKDYLLTPGPSSVPAEVLLAMAHPVFHHRTPRFQAVLKEALERSRRALMTANPVAILASSGTGAMEAAVANLASAGRKALTIEGGKFGERWGDLCRAFGFEHEAITVEWGKAVLVVDAISSAGACELRTDDWKVDVVCVGSQKGLMLPPGLALISVSPKAQALIEATEGRRAYYFDLVKALKSAAKDDTPYTPALTLVIGLNEALRMIEEEGIEELFARHELLSSAVRAGVQALGLELFAERPSASVTSVRLPEGVDGVALVKTLRDVEGVAFAGGQAALKGRIMRIATMGYCGKYDVILGLGALEMGLAKAGVEVELGAGVRAAEEVFLKD